MTGAAKETEDEADDGGGQSDAPQGAISRYGQRHPSFEGESLDAVPGEAKVVRGGIARASVRDTLAFLGDVVLPTFGKGLFLRRPGIVAFAEWAGLEMRAVRRMQRMRRIYGCGILLLAIPGRRHAVVLSPENLHRVLGSTPEPFAPATREKTSGLGHFEPKVSLISRPPERGERRRFNDDILESGRATHSMANAMLAAVDDEARTLLDAAGPEMTWPAFTRAWHRALRRVVLGDGARNDEALTEMLTKLRGDANWAFLHPGRPALRRRFQGRLAAHLLRAEPGSLAALIAAHGVAEETAVVDQVTHWLFAGDPAGIATFRALALIATHPEAQGRGRAEAEVGGGAAQSFLRACFMESVRLWPTAPAILRETTREVSIDGARIPDRTSLLIYAPFFHRDDENLPQAHRFAPELWVDARPPGSWPLVPFSDGPATCPAHHLVPMLGSAMLASVLRRRRVSLPRPGALHLGRPIPATFDSFRTRIALHDIGGANAG